MATWTSSLYLKSANSWYGAFDISGLYYLYPTTVSNFQKKTINQNEYLKFDLYIEGSDSYDIQNKTIAIAECTPTTIDPAQLVYTTIDWNTTTEVISTYGDPDGLDRQILLSLRVLDSRYATVTYYLISIKEPHRIRKATNVLNVVYSNSLTLGTTGSVTGTFALTFNNPGIITGILDNLTVFEQTTTSYTYSKTYDADGIGSHNLTLDVVPDLSIQYYEDNYGESFTDYVYWFDQWNGVHASYKRNNKNQINYNPTINVNFSVVDNANIFTLNSQSVDCYRSDHTTRLNWFLKGQGCIKLQLSFTYTATANNNFTIRLYDSSRTNGDVYINESVSYNAPGTHNLTYWSGTIEKSQTVLLTLEIKDKYNRVRTYTFAQPTFFYDYNRPKIKNFDAYFSNSSGTMDLQSTHFTAQSEFTYTPLDGTVTLSQSMTVGGGTAFNPALTSDTKKYISNANAQVPITTNQVNVVFTITDSLGGTDSVTFVLSRKGGVLLDFNNTGYGMAIGKQSEQNALEINLPTIFYNGVSYSDGTRVTTDAAINLGFMDTYGTGCHNLQEILDYLVNRVLNG